MNWIEIPNWDRFQHYGLHRRPAWIKNYTSLLRKDEYLDLPLAARGLLHGIWLAYADRDGRLRSADLSSVLLARARDAHLAALNDAGLIAFSASRPLNLNSRALSEQLEDAAGEPATRPNAEAYILGAGRLEPQPIDLDWIEVAQGWLAEHPGK
jgi:hypothetical protein